MSCRFPARYADVISILILSERHYAIIAPMLSFISSSAASLFLFKYLHFLLPRLASSRRFSTGRMSLLTQPFQAYDRITAFSA